MTFQARYNQSTTWHEKVLIMEIFHLAMCQRKDVIWNIAKTASEFGVSAGLVSENLQLARAIHKNEKIMDEPTRNLALIKIKVMK